MHVQDVQVCYIGKRVPWWFAAPINPSHRYSAQHALAIFPNALPTLTPPLDRPQAKNKLRGQKSKNVFHIANQKNFKAKNKAKPVTTNLFFFFSSFLRQTNRVNKAFVNVQKELAHVSKGLSLEPLQKELIPQQCHESKPVNVGEATKLMAQL
uniref:Uncharacterized protein n=1 Tax=Theropithecus gelada TaxID=9565 RepID=A0A8D2EDH8_THEGE